MITIDTQGQTTPTLPLSRDTKANEKTKAIKQIQSPHVHTTVLILLSDPGEPGVRPSVCNSSFWDLCDSGWCRYQLYISTDDVNRAIPGNETVGHICIIGERGRKINFSSQKAHWTVQHRWDTSQNDHKSKGYLPACAFFPKENVRIVITFWKLKKNKFLLGFLELRALQGPSGDPQAPWLGKKIQNNLLSF